MTRVFWRSLDEARRLATDDAGSVVAVAAPVVDLGGDGVSRREFLRTMAASFALAGLGGCERQPDEEIVPYVRTPTGAVPGEPRSYATAIPIAGFGIGVLATSRDGRPVKIEGNPDHPSSLGATDALLQASVLELYDPDRSQFVSEGGRRSSWSAARDALLDRVRMHRERAGRGLRILTGAVTSPTLAAQLERLLDQMPQARRHAYEPLASTAALQGCRAAFGESVVPRLRLDRAEVVLCLDANVLAEGPARVRHAHDFAEARRVRRKSAKRNRLYAVEPALSVTGSVADHRFALRPSEVRDVAFALLDRIAKPASEPNARFPWLDAVARDLAAHNGTALVVAGDGQSPEVHAAACALNAALGAIGKTVEYAEPLVVAPEMTDFSLAELVRDIAAGEVQTLLVLASNPAYCAPADLGIAAALQRVEFTLQLGLHADETAQVCRWHVPEAHALESWADVRGHDDGVSIMQPLIAPLYGGRTAAEVVALVVEGRERTGYELVREQWRPVLSERKPFEPTWRRCLRDGLVPATQSAPKHVELVAGFAPAASSEAAAPTTVLEVAFRADPSVLDGRFANNAWLQELPRPLTKITWDNAAHLSPRTAERLGLATGDMVELSLRGRSVAAAVLVAPGHADDCVTLPLGYGRRAAGRVGNGVGFDAYALRDSSAPWNDVGLTLRATGARHEFACTQDHHAMEGRDLVRSTTVAEFARTPADAPKPTDRVAGDDLYPPRRWDGPAWAMTIDLGGCIGCGACVLACVAENNIPAVGRREVMRGHEMHWLRVDTYFEGDSSAPRAFHQPVPCMHCEEAPCEVVCPVEATVHSHEGLNEMVYNRCVGTRYCSNNCPWKVRRFNWFGYAEDPEPPLALANNPDVSVRSRGVMEKCTYCVQRIDRARSSAKKENRAVKDGEVVTACQSACPTKAIVFGDRNDAASRVAAEKAEPHEYALLGHLGTRPRTTYLAHVANPNPEV